MIFRNELIILITPVFWGEINTNSSYQESNFWLLQKMRSKIVPYALKIQYYIDKNLCAWTVELVKKQCDVEYHAHQSVLLCPKHARVTCQTEDRILFKFELNRV